MWHLPAAAGTAAWAPIIAYCRIKSALAALGLASRLDVHACAAGEASQLVAYIRTPGGLVELD